MPHTAVHPSVVTRPLGQSPNRIDQAFARLKQEKRVALIAYVTGGFPSMKATDRAVRDLEAAGADIVEVGIPFSDPIADGPTIQFSSQKALEAGATLSGLLAWAKSFRRHSALPLVFMSYMNPIYLVGFSRFARQAKESGVDGLIVPDLIPEEAEDLKRALTAQGIHLIFLAAPTTPPARRRLIGGATRGFLYAVSVTGVTGARRGLASGVPAFLADLRRASRAPVAVGFGISSPAQARRMASYADGVIVGSAFIERLKKNVSVGPFARALRRALDHKR